MRTICQTPRSSRCFHFPSLAPVMVLALLSGCASIDSKPFAKYKSAVQEAQTGIDAAMSVNYNWTRSGFIEGFASDPDAKFSRLIIKPGPGYDWSLTAPPLYLTVKQTRAALAGLNEAFAEYVDLLGQLAARDLVSTDKFEQMAKDLNKSVRKATTVLNVKAPPEEVALFSTVATEFARLYIENKRRGHLHAAIQVNQPNVENYAGLCISLIHTIRGSMKAYYNDRIEPIKLAWNASPGEKRQKYTEAMLILNEQFADGMRVLQELETTYRALPKAHADLAKAIQQPKLNLEGIQELYSSAKRLQRLYGELNKTEGNSTKS